MKSTIKPYFIWRPPQGYQLHKACKELLRMAKQHPQVCGMYFLGTVVEIQEGDKSDDIYDRWTASRLQEIHA